MMISGVDALTKVTICVFYVPTNKPNANTVVSNATMAALLTRKAVKGLVSEKKIDRKIIIIFFCNQTDNQKILQNKI